MVKMDLDKLRKLSLEQFQEMGIDPIHFKDLMEKTRKMEKKRAQFCSGLFT